MTPLEERVNEEKNDEEIIEIIQKVPKKRFRQRIKPYLLSISVPLLMSLSYGAGSLEEKMRQDTPIINTTITIQTPYDSLLQAHKTLQEEYAVLTLKLEKTQPATIPEIAQPPLAIDTMDIPLGSYFIEVNKPEQRVKIWQRTNYTLVANVPTSTGKNKGEKERQGDNKSPTGYATIMTKENSNHWLYEGEPAYGPWFFRLNFGEWDAQGNYNPQGHCSIGIHGTNEPEYLGIEKSHGCVRVENEFLKKAATKEYIAPGVQVYFTPYPQSQEVPVFEKLKPKIRKISEKSLTNINNKEITYTK